MRLMKKRSKTNFYGKTYKNGKSVYLFTKDRLDALARNKVCTYMMINGKEILFTFNLVKCKNEYIKVES